MICSRLCAHATAVACLDMANPIRTIARMMPFTQALKNPLMDRGRMLADATHVLVQVAGGPGMTLSEVEILMQELGATSAIKRKSSLAPSWTLDWETDWG